MIFEGAESIFDQYFWVRILELQFAMDHRVEKKDFDWYEKRFQSKCKSFMTRNMDTWSWDSKIQGQEDFSNINVVKSTLVNAF